ncbi:hypothetical protein [Priestia megaterium]|uniref:hypothetical protein n=1 Tax=Priestia megaterium TaxID=1404 RepID=UPI001CD586D3|nr:hypothetical protein [Priestia megaterium]
MTKKEQNFKSLDSLKWVEKVINEARAALKDQNRLIVNSAIPEVLGAIAGAGTGGAISFTALYTAGVAGLSAAGITSGLATAGAIVGGGMTAGVFVLATPVAALAVGGYVTLNYAKNKKLKQEKERLYREALQKHDALQIKIMQEVDLSKGRFDYLNSLVILLSHAVKDLEDDLANN